ncbi:MAG: helix-turn-helix domain-containing protein [Chloroflexi bacterium]|nr:helix-turn-helix domain-containing protein [Chloroflexota bacterium]
MHHIRFSTLLARHLEARERSASWLARRVGVSAATANRWLSGETRPQTPERVIDIARALGITEPEAINELLTAAGYATSIGPQSSRTREKGANKPLDLNWDISSLPEDRASEPSSSPSRFSITARWANLRRGFRRGKRPALAIPRHCGHAPVRLQEQTLALSAAFGVYFVGLLERENSFVSLQNQLEMGDAHPASTIAYVDVVQRLLSNETHIIILASYGGMGKSTVAAQIIRCLFELGAADVILGDSAKSKIIDANLGEPKAIEPGYSDAIGFFYRLREQLGLPQQTRISPKQYTRDIRDRLYGRRAIIFVDNLETVAARDQIVRFLSAVVSPNIRALVTTRRAFRETEYPGKTALVHLRPITDISDAAIFLRWHIDRYRHENPLLTRLSLSLDEAHLQRLIQVTGGMPLLMQIVASNVARLSWSYLDDLPKLLGDALLNSLYEQAWRELQAEGRAGRAAQRVLQRIAHHTHSGHRITFDTMRGWFKADRRLELLPQSLTLLYERFLIVNNDLEQGDFAITPSLAEFVSRQ